MQTTGLTTNLPSPKGSAPFAGAKGAYLREHFSRKTDAVLGALRPDLSDIRQKTEGKASDIKKKSVTLSSVNRAIVL